MRKGGGEHIKIFLRLLIDRGHPEANFPMTTILSNFRVAILAALATVHCIPSAKASPINIDAITIKAGEVYVLGSGPSLGLPPPFVVVTGTISIAPTGFVDLLILIRFQR